MNRQMKGECILCVVGAFLLASCSYRGQLRQDGLSFTAVYPPINSSVRVISHENQPRLITLSDPTSQALYDFTLDVKTGVYESAVAMLSSCFEQVQTESTTAHTPADWVAEVLFTAEMTRSDCTSQTPQLAVRQNGICSRLTVSFKPSHSTQNPRVFSQRRWRPFEQPGVASVLRAVNKWTFYILSPITLPAYTQLQGKQLRQQLQTQLQDMLQALQKQLQTQQDVLLTR